MHLRPTDRARIEARYVRQQYVRWDDHSNVGLRDIPRLKVEYQLSRPIFLRFVGQYDAQRQDALRDDGRTNDPLLILNPKSGRFERSLGFRNNNFRGVKSKAVDHVLEVMGKVTTLEELTDAARALDRIVMWNFWQVPDLYLDTLMAQQLYTHTSVVPTAPVSPEQGRRTDDERMQEHADLARLRISAAIPLALLAQRTGTTPADAGSIHDAQASIGFSALLMRDQLLGSRAPQRPIGLESKVLAREATSFPGGPHLRRSIAGGRSGGC